MSIYSNPSAGAREQADAYIKAILELLGDRDPMSILRNTSKRLEAITQALNGELLSRAEAPGKWSVVQVLQHLADSELVWGWRLRLVLAQDRPEITGYDQDAWAEKLNYACSSREEAIGQFRVLRNGNVSLLDGLGEEQLKRVGIHKERGEESIEYMIRLYAGHDLVHLRQIERIRDGLRSTDYN